MADTGFLIGEVFYDVPGLDSFNMDEAEILYKCSGLTLEDFALDEEDPEQAAQLAVNIKNPGFVRALMIIAYLRGDSNTTYAKAASVIGKTNVLEALKNLAEGDVDPPEPTRTENGNADSGESSASSSVPSGGTSIEGLAAQEDPRVVTGTSA